MSSRRTLSRGVKLPGLRDRRERALLTQAELAQLAQLSRTTVHSVENGGNATRDTIRKLADALKCEPDDLMPTGRRRT